MASVTSIVLGAIAFTKRRTLQQKIRASRQAKVSATTKHGQSARQIRGRARIGAERLKGDDDDDDDDDDHHHDDYDADVNFSISEVSTFTKIDETRQPKFMFFILFSVRPYF